MTGKAIGCGRSKAGLFRWMMSIRLSVGDIAIVSVSFQEVLDLGRELLYRLVLSLHILQATAPSGAPKGLCQLAERLLSVIQA